MQTPRNAPRKGIKFLDAKVFIAVTSLAVTAGFWNLFSVNTVQADQNAVGPDASPPPDQQAEIQQLPSLPTLVPLVKVEISLPGSLSASVQTRGDSQALRSVTAPTQVVVQKFKPVIDQPQTAAVDNGGGGKTTRSVTRTRSSR